MGGKYKTAIMATLDECARDWDITKVEAIKEISLAIANGMAERIGFVNVNGVGLNSMPTVTPLYVLFAPED